jgi:SAM-dependent methyltransferase
VECQKKLHGLSFSTPEQILKQMEFTKDLDNVVDFGCGFGTFTIPASLLIKGKIHAFDIDPDMIALLKGKIDFQNLKNIELHLKDFIVDGSGLKDYSIDYVILFNILHHDNPNQILKEIFRILKPGSKAGIVHWRSDIETPRGPQLDIRPTPEQCKHWAIESGFVIRKEIILEPYHFGTIISKP